MNKSTNDAIDDFSKVVSRLDVGKRVIVNKLYAGKLKYVGKVVGKDRIYCGVELDQPIGKHDGTYQNISYFDCRPMHGIFAPTYKVQLEEDNWNKKDLLFEKSNKLIKSAIPSLTNNKLKQSRIYKNVNNINNPINFTKLLAQKQDKNNRYDDSEMDWSLLSNNSSVGMNNSLFSSSGNSYNEEDFMINSHHTYVVTDSDCLMLSDIEICDNNLLKLEEDDDYLSSNQQFLKVSRTDSVDAKFLPVIPSSLSTSDNEFERNEEELDTPMIDDNSKQFPHLTNEIANETSENNDNCKLLDCKDTDALSANLNNQNTSTKETILKKSDQKILINKKINKKINKLQKNLTKEMTNNQEASLQKSERPSKKPRISIREMMKQPTSVTTARQPKPLSKSQLIMERVKASIEAEKKKLKKEVKSKVNDKLFTLTETSPTNLNSELESNHESNTEQENMTRGTVVLSQKPLNHSIASKKAILSQNSKISTNNNVIIKNLKKPTNCPNNNINKEQNLKLKNLSCTSSISRPPLKPRQTHLPPFLTANTTSTNENANSNLMKSEVLALQRQQISLFCASFPRNSNRLYNKSLNMQLLPKSNSRLHLSTTSSILKSNNNLKTSNYNASLKFDVKRQLLEENERVKNDCTLKFNQKCEELTGQILALQRDRDSVEDKRAKLAGEYEDLQKENYKVIENWKTECKNLENQLKEAQQTCEQLIAHKNELETTLQKDESEKVQKLSSEINSLKFVLDTKNEEVKKLRSENHELQFIVETIPAKDCENQKLVHKVSDLKDDLKRQRDIQKTINQQLDECMRELKLKTQKYEKLEKDNEMLRFKVQALIEANEQSDCENNARITPNHENSPYSSWKLLTCSTPLSVRSKEHGLLESQSNSPSSHLNSQLLCQTLSSQNVNGVMCKSLDSASLSHNTLGNKTERSLLSIYQEQGRRQVNTPTKIYAPDGTYEVNEFDISPSTPKMKTAKEHSLIETSPHLSIKSNNFFDINQRYCDFNVSEDLNLSTT